MNTEIAILDSDGLYCPQMQEEQLLAIFSHPGMLSAITGRVKDMAMSSAGNPAELMTTKKGRDAIKASAAKVTRSKTYLDDLGKKVVADLKELPKLIDGNRKTMRDELDALATAIRQPLTVWEERTKEIGARLVELDGLPTAMAGRTADEVEMALDHLHETSINPNDWDGLFDDANAIYARVEPALVAMVARKRKEEADAAELSKLRVEAEKRAKLDADSERIQAAAERESQAALGREAEAKRQAEIAEQRAAKAEAESVQLRAQVAQQTAVAVAAPVAVVTTVRATVTNVDHRKAINRAAAEAIDAILAFPAPDGSTHSREIVRAVIQGRIPGMSITY